MDIKKLKLDMRTAIYLLIIILLIISIAYLVSTGSDDSDEILSVNNVLLNKEAYVGDNIKVRGVYASITADENYLKSSFTTDLDQSTEMLRLNLDALNNSVRENLSEDNQYIVTGVLSHIETDQGSQILNVELVVSKIEEV